MTTERAFQTAVQHYQSGRLAEAEALCRQILSAQPHCADALHLLGVIAHNVGRNDVAVELIQQAIALAPNAWEMHCGLGEAYRQLGRLDEAIAVYRQVLRIKPGQPEIHNNLGASFRAQGRLGEAVEEFRRAIEFQPDYAEAHCNLGTALRDQGHLDEAIAAYRRAIAVRPGFAGAHNSLAMVLRDQGHLDEAIAAYHRAIELRPGYPEAHNNLANALQSQGRLDEAIAGYHRAIELRPDYAEACCNLGIALREQGRFDEALAAQLRAIELRSDLAEAHCNLGIVLWDQGRLNEAFAAFRRALELRPDFPKAHYNLGNTLRDQGHLAEALAAYNRAHQLDPDWATPSWNTSLLLLLQGDFEHGWPLFEYRWEDDDFKRSKRNFPQPMWQGEALDGRRILLHAEQGLGDTLQFIRYAPLVAARGGHVIVECPPALKTLLTNVEGITQIIGFGEPIPAFDLHCPMMSLPLAFGTRLETIPASIPYLQAYAAKTDIWQKRLEQEGVPSVSSQHRPLKVGLVWAGGERPHQPKLRPVDQRRSMRLDQFAPLAKVPGVVFVSLQKGAPSAQAKSPPEGMTLVDWTDELTDFTDTAALVEALDLVISVDTAVAHLAGALGKPVWLLNRFDTCWRWLLNRTDSPWYPTMRLFRQPGPGEWEPVMEEVGAALRKASTVNPTSRTIGKGALIASDRTRDHASD